jgi:hypothetical protein
MKRLLVAFTLSITPAVAQAVTYTSSDGTTYQMGQTYTGDVLIIADQMPDDVNLLLRNCTARHETYGTGRWEYANDGWLIEYPDVRIVFSNEQPPPVDTKLCGLP